MNHLVAARCGWLLAVGLAVVVLIPCQSVADDSLITNGDFQKWTDGAPDGWKLEIGAMNGADSPKSTVKQIDGPAILLSGNAETMAWYSVSQELAAKVGTTCQLTFESRAKDIRREGRQFNNCYVGLLSFGADGKLAGKKIEDVSTDGDWTKHQATYTIPANATKTQVIFFLSKSGSLAVKNLGVVEVAPKAAFPDTP